VRVPRVTGNNLSMDEARQYERGLRAKDSDLTSPSPEPPASSSAAVDETRVLSFAELKELIESGRVDQIPNNKIIPEKFSVRRANMPSCLVACSCTNLYLFDVCRKNLLVSLPRLYERNHGRPPRLNH
jgi:hypothetical protein